MLCLRILRCPSYFYFFDPFLLLNFWCCMCGVVAVYQVYRHFQEWCLVLWHSDVWNIDHWGKPVPLQQHKEQGIQGEIEEGVWVSSFNGDNFDERSRSNLSLSGNTVRQGRRVTRVSDARILWTWMSTSSIFLHRSKLTRKGNSKLSPRWKSRMQIQILSCFSNHFQVMKSCWDIEPSDRPTFRDLVRQLIRMQPSHHDLSWSNCHISKCIEYFSLKKIPSEMEVATHP